MGGVRKGRGDEVMFAIRLLSCHSQLQTQNMLNAWNHGTVIWALIGE